MSSVGMAELEVIEHDLVTYFDAADAEHQQSYALGLYLAERLTAFESHPEIDSLILGLRDGLSGYSRLETDCVHRQIAAWQDTWRLLQQKNAQTAQETQLAAAKTFWEQNREKPTVRTSASGLQWEVLKEGQGGSPKASDHVVLQYRGYFSDGREFDSSQRRGAPLGIRVEDTLPGWREALVQMSAGAQWRLTLLPHLAFGPNGMPPHIPGDTLLVYEIELINIEKSGGFP